MAGPKKRPLPLESEIRDVYPRLNLREAGAYFGVGQTLFSKWLKYYGIERTKIHRVPTSDEARRNMSKAQKLRPPRQRYGLEKPCDYCGKVFYVSPPRLKAATKHYCSYACLGAAKRKEYPSKVCAECGGTFSRREGETAGNYQRKVYCSAKCSTTANPPPIKTGEDNPRYKGESARRKQARGRHSAWARRVLSRDKATCQHCDASDVPLVAHHVLSWEDFPELRTDIDNGVTLCNPCHYKEHGWELSPSGIKSIINERGIEERRWTGNCLWCGTFIVKQASDMRRPDGTYRDYGYCSTQCRGSASGFFRRNTPKDQAKGEGFSIEQIKMLPPGTVLKDLPENYSLG